MDEIEICHSEMGMRYSISAVEQVALWATEGFGSRAEMDRWFREVVKRGETGKKFLMRFRLWTETQDFKTQDAKRKRRGGRRETREKRC